jgi:hypothetical protein
LFSIDCEQGDIFLKVWHAKGGGKLSWDIFNDGMAGIKFLWALVE